MSTKPTTPTANRADFAKWKIKPVIHGCSKRRVEIKRDRALHKQRNRIKRMFDDLNRNRAAATRYNQLASSFPGMIIPPPPDPDSIPPARPKKSLEVHANELHRIIVVLRCPH
ncbi:transposase [Sphingomonas carotinifaciens]|uniref:Transposase n=1 Tax=Sphingomonas carotinifaciens TaxID=1166323 RepID=A0A6N8LNR5_9SPHN|nr:transposase [Sphingomonas carotinifaciens]